MQYLLFYCWDQLSKNWLSCLAGPKKKHFTIYCHGLKFNKNNNDQTKIQNKIKFQCHTQKKERVRGNPSGVTGDRLFFQKKKEKKK